MKIAGIKDTYATISLIRSSTIIADVEVKLQQTHACSDLF